MNVLDELLKIKVFRETQAQAKVQKQRIVRARKQTEKHAAETVLAEKQVFAIKEERALFRALMGEPVKVRQIEEVRGQVGVTKNEVVRLDTVSQEAGEALRQAQVDVDEAQAALRVAEQKTSKFVELVRLHADETFRQAERLEDLEMEEAASAARTRDNMDWSDYEQAAQDD